MEQRQVLGLPSPPPVLPLFCLPSSLVLLIFGRGVGDAQVSFSASTLRRRLGDALITMVGAEHFGVDENHIFAYFQCRSSTYIWRVRDLDLRNMINLSTKVNKT